MREQLSESWCTTRYHKERTPGFTKQRALLGRFQVSEARKPPHTSPTRHASVTATDIGRGREGPRTARIFVLRTAYYEAQATGLALPPSPEGLANKTGTDYIVPFLLPEAGGEQRGTGGGERRASSAILLLLQLLLATTTTTGSWKLEEEIYNITQHTHTTFYIEVQVRKEREALLAAATRKASDISGRQFASRG
jgi:hypothetical protein